MKDEMPEVIFIQLSETKPRNMRKFDTERAFEGATVYVNYDAYQSEVKRLRDALELARNELRMIAWQNQETWSQEVALQALTAIDAALEGK